VNTKLLYTNCFQYKTVVHELLSILCTNSVFHTPGKQAVQVLQVSPSIASTYTDLLGIHQDLVVLLRLDEAVDNLGGNVGAKVDAQRHGGVHLTSTPN
jgi:hypothetical protein